MVRCRDLWNALASKNGSTIMAESTCTKASSAMTAVYDRDVHSVATHRALKISLALAKNAVVSRSKMIQSRQISKLH